MSKKLWAYAPKTQKRGSRLKKDICVAKTLSKARRDGPSQPRGEKRLSCGLDITSANWPLSFRVPEAGFMRVETHVLHGRDMRPGS